MNKIAYFFAIPKMGRTSIFVKAFTLLVFVQVTVRFSSANILEQTGECKVTGTPFVVFGMLGPSAESSSKVSERPRR